MIDNDNEVSLVYLLEPTFQMMNTAGKPLTDGYLEVYIHGTRDRYYCSSDFDGTLHPFKVPLDSLGSNIVLVSPFNSYDIYVYNKYGSLQMSRYNVTPGSNWVDISGQEQYFIGEGQLTVDASLGSSSYLLDNLTQIDGNLPVSSGNLELPDECLYNVEANIEFEVLNYNLLNQDVELSVEIKNPCRVTEHTNTIKGFTTINTTNVNKNTLTLCGLIYGGMDSLYGTPHLEITFKRDDESTTPATIRAHLTNISVYKIGGLFVGQGTGGADYNAGPGVRISGNTISTKVDGETIVYNANGEMVSVGGQTYTAGQYISIDNNVISASGLQPAGDYATVSELNSSIQAATALIPDVSDFVTNSELNTVSGILEGQIQNVSASIPDVSDFVTSSDLQTVYGDLEGDIQTVSAAIPDISGLATKQELQVVSASIPDISDLATETYVNNTLVSAKNYTDTQIGNLPTPVNADWTSNSGLSQILHKPTEIPLIAGTGIELTTSDNSIIISASAIPADYVTESELENTLVSAKNYTDSQISNIPPQVNSDWDAVSGVSQILNKPDIINLVAGSGISITSLNDEIVISASGTGGGGSGVTYTAGNYIDLTNNVISVTGVQPAGDYATYSQLQTVSAAIPDAQVNADWNAVSGISEILNKPLEMNLVAGDNVTLTASGNDVIIETTEMASGLQVIADHGVTLTASGSYLIASLDETVLYTANAASNTIVLSEKATNFERLRLELQSCQSNMVVNYTEIKPNDGYLTYFAQTLIPAATYPLQILGVQFTSTDGITYTMSRGIRAYYKPTADWGGNDSSDMTSNIKDAGFITKIVGINRIS